MTATRLELVPVHTRPLWQSDRREDAHTVSLSLLVLVVLLPLLLLLLVVRLLTTFEEQYHFCLVLGLLALVCLNWGDEVRGVRRLM